MTEDEEGDDAQGSDSTGDPELDRQVTDLEQSGEKVSDRIEETQSDWEAKKDDPSVPGAMPDPTAAGDEEDDSGDEQDDSDDEQDHSGDDDAGD